MYSIYVYMYGWTDVCMYTECMYVCMYVCMDGYLQYYIKLK